ncbi:MAG: carbohydrate kinase family protein [Zestosphaera sp.]
MRDVKLLVVGSLNYDVMLFVERFAPPKTRVNRLKTFLGGSGGNAAVSAAKILGPGKVAFLGAVGDDEIGRLQLNDLERHGVITNHVVKISRTPSGQSFVAVSPDGDTAVYSYYGANEFLQVEHVSNALATVGEDFEGLLVMNPPLNVARFLVGEASRRSKKVFWDPGMLAAGGLRELSPVMMHVDYLMPNEWELLMMTGANNVLGALDKLARHTRRPKLVIKSGVRGSYLVDLSLGTLTHVASVDPQALGLKLVSTSGCGDTYTGVFTAYKLCGFEDVTAMTYASCASTIKASKEDPRGAPSKEELENLHAECVKIVSVEERHISL